ncbi:hypothetical protein HYX03_00745, partial [Candidatus Woesearchaeota archaeon]|nr:hypothetical protein [Candidatus Woesearchaeota archaeon]
EDKWNIHSSSYNSSKYGNIFSDGKKEDKKYHEQKYGSKEKNVASDYIRKQDEKEAEDRNKNVIFDGAEEEKKEQKTEEDEIQLKAAKQIFSEKKFEAKKDVRKKEAKTIEDAIRKAIEEEKKVIVMDN